jgi:hypothetical protein
MNAGLPGHEKAEAATTQVSEGQAPSTEQPGEASPKQQFLIGDQKFDSIEQAMNYAQGLEREKLERDAYELGKQEAQPKAEPEANPDAEFYKKISDLMFENPGEAIRMIEERAVQKAESTITQKSEAQRTQEQTWNKFYDGNKDLVAHKDIVDFILERNWDTLGPMQPERALQKLAELTRTKINEVVKSVRPEEVLPEGNTNVTQATGEPVTVKVPEKQKLDFAQQVRKLNKRELKAYYNS